MALTDEPRYREALEAAAQCLHDRLGHNISYVLIVHDRAQHDGLLSVCGALSELMVMAHQFEVSIREHVDDFSDTTH